ncbi:formyltetrahydrofolate deformylase [Sulfitobacter sp. 1A13421]|uniref:formyltetrahydrofolate deformylase n=1 Tax=Sulfitobacter sp. 1A13421 TaxID=3368595 RepID=UPI003745DA9A
MAQDRLELSASHQPTAALSFFSEGESQRLEAAMCDDFVPRVFPLWTHEREKSFEVTTSKQFFAASKSRLRLVGSPTLCDCDIPFHYIKVTKENKPEAEARIMAVVEEVGGELIVLARYMQVLSDAMCQKMSGRINNIHHSFLPSFKGANPYKQAYERGVKLIGATSHYVTADLDEGPIIEQDTVRVTHAQNGSDYVSLGRDVEASVLARAVHAHANYRVFLIGNKTVVLPASPGSYSSKRMG